MSQPAEEQLMTPEGMSAASTAAPSTAFMEFEAAYTANGSDACYCMVEGYDAPYYQTRVEGYIPNPIFINCGNKNNVIRLHTTLQDRAAYQAVKKLYFVDRDYDDNSGLSADFCLTEGYSVENYYGGENFIRKFLVNSWHLKYHEDNEDFVKILTDYLDFESKFVSATSRFCAWYAVARERATYKNPDYKEKFPTDLAEISQSDIQDKGYTLSELNARYPLSSDVTQEEFDARLPRMNKIGEIRGKFVLKFIIIYLNRLAYKGKKLGLLKENHQMRSNDPEFMYYHSICAQTPQSLMEYLKRNQ